MPRRDVTGSTSAVPLGGAKSASPPGKGCRCSPRHQRAARRWTVPASRRPRGRGHPGAAWVGRWGLGIVNRARNRAKGMQDCHRGGSRAGVKLSRPQHSQQARFHCPRWRSASGCGCCTAAAGALLRPWPLCRGRGTGGGWSHPLPPWQGRGSTQQRCGDAPAAVRRAGQCRRQRRTRGAPLVTFNAPLSVAPCHIP